MSVERGIFVVVYAVLCALWAAGRGAWLAPGLLSAGDVLGVRSERGGE